MVSRLMGFDGSGDEERKPFYRSLFLKPRETAYIQFISTDIEQGSDLFICQVHRTTQVDPVTQRERFPIFLCFNKSMEKVKANESLLEFPQSQAPCPFCVSSNVNEQRAIYKFYYWVYVSEIWHKEQNPRLTDSNANFKPWEKKQTKAGDFYVERIGKPMILEQGWGFTKNLYSIYTRMERIDNKTFLYTREVVNERSYYNVVPYQDIDPEMSIKELDAIRENLPPLYTLVVPRILYKPVGGSTYVGPPPTNAAPITPTPFYDTVTMSTVSKEEEVPIITMNDEKDNVPADDTSNDFITPAIVKGEPIGDDTNEDTDENFSTEAKDNLADFFKEENL